MFLLPGRRVTDPTRAEVMASTSLSLTTDRRPLQHLNRELDKHPDQSYNTHEERQPSMPNPCPLTATILSMLCGSSARWHRESTHIQERNQSMTATHQPRWLEWAREIQSLAQTGITFSENDYEVQRLRRLMEIAAEIVEAHTGLPKEPLVDNFLAQPGYATPKIDVRGAAVRKSQILLVKERTDGRWCMPGGWADVGEYPSEGVAREVWEESGFEVVVRKVIGVYDTNRGGVPLSFYHAYKIVYLCEITGGEAGPSSETEAVGFFDFDNLPELSSFRTNEIHLEEVRAHLGDDKRPTAFD